MFGRGRIPSKSDADLVAMRAAGLVVAAALDEVVASCRAGTTTADLDRVATAAISERGGVPSFPEVPGYRHTLCVSVNEQVVHGIPGPRELADGDVVSIDCGAILDGWHGDSAVSVIVGGPGAARPADLELIDVAREALWAGIGAMAVGNRISHIGTAIEEAITAAAAARGTRFGIVDGYEGHGIGRAMHMAPGVPNTRTRYRGPVITSGTTLAIEPMVSLGDERTYELSDGWTAVTVDGSRAAHWEHTVAVTDAGLWVLTAHDGGAADLAARGLPFGPLDAA